MPTGLPQLTLQPQASIYLLNPEQTPILDKMPIVDELVSRTFRLPQITLHATTRSRRKIAFARQVAMYLGHVCLSYKLRELALYYNRDRTTIAYACRVIEERRDDPDLELVLNSLESALLLLTRLAPEPWPSCSSVLEMAQ